MDAEHASGVRWEPPVRTSVRLVWLAGLLYAVAAATHPGADGRHLVGLILTVTTALGWAAWLSGRHYKRLDVSIAGIVVLGASGGVMVVLSPAGVVVVGVAGMCAASLLEFPLAVALGAVGVAAAAAAVTVTGHAAGVVGGAAGGALAGVTIGMSRRQQQAQVRHDAELTLARQRSQVEHDRAEVLADRNRVAREVHDVLAHTLSALSVQLEALDSLIDDLTDATTIRAAVHRSRRLVTDGLDETRRAVRTLRDEPVDVAGQVATLTGDAGAAFHLHGDHRPLPPAHGLALVSVAREALTNARKHAPGAPVTVDLTFANHSTCLTVDSTLPTTTAPLADSGGGYGLRGMRERVELLGGSFNAGGDGTAWRVHAEIPA